MHTGFHGITSSSRQLLAYREVQNIAGVVSLVNMGVFGQGLSADSICRVSLFLLDARRRPSGADEPSPEDRIQPVRENFPVRAAIVRNTGFPNAV